MFGTVLIAFFKKLKCQFLKKRGSDKDKSVGICGSDLEVYDGRFRQSIPPLIIGHEGGGIVKV